MQNIYAYSEITHKLRHFFQDELGFIEIPVQCRLSILAACEDPSTISPFRFNNTLYPLPQTGQMWLEAEILKNPGVPGVFCISTSYRDEPNPIPGRHEKVFPMFEFEAPGNLDALRRLETALVTYLGFKMPVSVDYETMCQHYGVSEIRAPQELQMQQEFGDVISLEHFPLRTHPFWNMKHDKNNIYNKIDVILAGMETIGSAERETDTDKMREGFFTISNGQYAQLLFNAFGKERIIKELEEYLSLPFFPRFGAGIGITRLARAMQHANLLKCSKQFKAMAA